MSKYIYTTIYEQFTGLKPPEPKDHKPRRRRGFGHPYRMRLNMQENADQGSELLFSSHEPERDVFEQAQVSVFQPTVKKQSVRRFTSGNQAYRSSSSSNSTMSSYTPMPEDRHGNCEPKVTYKKRRQYGPSSLGLSSSIGRDGNDNSDY